MCGVTVDGIHHGAVTSLVDHGWQPCCFEPAKHQHALAEAIDDTSHIRCVSLSMEHVIQCSVY